MATLRPCSSSQHEQVTTPWSITVTVARPLVRKFRRSCRAAKRRSEFRKVVGNASRNVCEKLGRRAPDYFKKRKDLRGWTPKRIDSYNCRTIRDSTSYSRHAYAAAWDFFATPPGVVPPGGVWEPDNPVPAWFAREFTKRGFTWGAKWARADIPHIEWSSNTV